MSKRKKCSAAIATNRLWCIETAMEILNSVAHLLRSVLVCRCFCLLVPFGTTENKMEMNNFIDGSDNCFYVWDCLRMPDAPLCAFNCRLLKLWIYRHRNALRHKPKPIERNWICSIYASNNSGLEQTTYCTNVRIHIPQLPNTYESRHTHTHTVPCTCPRSNVQFVVVVHCCQTLNQLYLLPMGSTESSELICVVMGW